MGRTVLVANGHPARARRLAEACTARGLVTLTARNGAEALEVALADVPDAVVASAELALVDGPKLAEILRANPRTREVAFLFLGREGRLPRTGAFEAALPPQASADEVARRVEALLGQRARVGAIEREAAADQVVEGRLSQVPLTELLQLFHLHERSGTFELVRGEPAPDAGPGAGREEPSPPEWRGEIALREGHVARARTGRVESEKALFRMLGWREGRFRFRPHPVQGAARVTVATSTLLAEGIRQLDECERLRDSLPPLDARLSLVVSTDALPRGVHPLTRSVLEQLEQHDRVGAVVDACPWPDYQVLRTLQALAARRIVRLQAAGDGPAGAAPALFAPGDARRLREWVQAGRPPGLPGRAGRPLSAKVLLASADADATRDFVRALGELPGVEVAPALAAGRFRADDLGCAARLRVGEGLALDLVHVPTDGAFGPVWPVAAHGALATLLLLGPDPSAAESALAPLSRVLRERPGTRIFHLMLLRKGERVDLAELEARLSLLEEVSLFILQLETPASRKERLRALLARIAP